MGSYGTVPASGEASPTPRVTQGGSGRRVRRIAGVLAVAAVMCAAAISGVVLHRRMVRLGCDDITCAMNSPTAPPGTFVSEPRVLSPEEVDKLKAALEVEQNLEQKVPHLPLLVPPHAARARPWLHSPACSVGPVVVVCSWSLRLPVESLSPGNGRGHRHDSLHLHPGSHATLALGGFVVDVVMFVGLLLLSGWPAKHPPHPSRRH